MKPTLGARKMGKSDAHEKFLDLHGEMEDVQWLCQRLHMARDNNDKTEFDKTVDSLIRWGNHRDFDEYANSIVKVLLPKQENNHG